MSLSFAPYREGFNPLEKKFPLVEHIDEDLRLLADKTFSVRTYASTGGMEPVPQLVRKYGLTMMQGAWLGGNLQDNNQEVQALIRSANANPDVIKRVIVGNEVLLRGDLKPDQLIEYIRTVKRSVKQPITYADVWSMYMKYPQLIKEVDFITIHILPYWEDEPISVEVGLEHVKKIVKQVHDEAEGIAPGKSILIGETGWPGAGRQRGLAVPGVVNEAKFVRGLIQIANENGFDYNIVEAFNQPWKSELEGVVGANWGLLSVNRQSVFPLTGPVYENQQWLEQLIASQILWLILVLAHFRRLHFKSFGRLLLFLGLGQAFALALVSMTVELWYTSYNDWQRGYSLAVILANTGLAWLLLLRVQVMLAEREQLEGLAQWLRTGYFLFAALAVYKTLALAFTGRYISFPSSQLVVPVLGILGLVLCQWLIQRRLAVCEFKLNSLIGRNKPQSWEHSLIYLLQAGVALTFVLKMYELPMLISSLVILLGLTVFVLKRSGSERQWAYLLGLAILLLVVGETFAFMMGGDFILAHPNWQDGLPVALFYTLVNQQLVTWLALVAVLALPFAFAGCHREHPATQHAD